MWCTHLYDTSWILLEKEIRSFENFPLERIWNNKISNSLPRERILGGFLEEKSLNLQQVIWKEKKKKKEQKLKARTKRIKKQLSLTLSIFYQYFLKKTTIHYYITNITFSLKTTHIFALTLAILSTQQSTIIDESPVRTQHLHSWTGKIDWIIGGSPDDHPLSSNRRSTSSLLIIHSLLLSLSLFLSLPLSFPRVAR